MVPEFMFLPPEINSGLIFGGAGAGSLFAAAAAWAELASNLSASASSFSSVISALTSGNWTGPSAEAMAQAAVPYLEWLSVAAGHAEGAAAQAQVAGSAFETALAATVHPAAVAANRMTLMTLIATNILGQNTAAIFAMELEYIEMWLQDVLAMFGYHAGASSVAAALPSISAPPASLAGLLTTPLSDLASSASSLLSSGLSSFMGLAQSAIAQVVSAPVSSLVSVAQIGVYPASALVPPMITMAHGSAPVAAVAGASVGAGAANVLAGSPGLVGSTAPAMQALSGSGGLAPAMTAGLGSARFVGAISVPPAWQGSTPARIVTVALTGLESRAATVPVGTSGPTGVPVMSGSSSSAGARPGTPGATHGPGGPRAKHVVQSRPRVVPRTEVG